MRLIYLGTPRFAVPTLERLAAAGHDVVAVYTQPDRPKGRGREVAMSPVKEAALGLGLEVRQPERIRRPQVVAELAAYRVDAMVIVGYGQIIPQSIIDLAPLGIINVHASLLPSYRGAAPIQWAIANGETRTGVTTMRIDTGLDTGAMLLKRETEIGPDETAPELSERLAPMGADLLIETLDRLDEIVPEAQDNDAATLAPILRKEYGAIDWTAPAALIHNCVRGFQPWPGAYTTFRGQTLNVLRTRLSNDVIAGAPGALHPRKNRLFASTGEGLLELVELQLEGRRRMDAAAFLNGHRIAEDELVGAPA